MKYRRKITLLLSLALIVSGLTFIPKQVKALDSNKIDVVGYQYNICISNDLSSNFYKKDGFRINYTVPKKINNKNIKESGLIYSCFFMGGTVNEIINNMTTNSTNPYVVKFSNTTEGRISYDYIKQTGAVDYGSDNYYYAMTMTNPTKTKQFQEGEYGTRVYAVLEDNSVVYSNIYYISMYNLASTLYYNLKSRNEEMHNFLYDNIIKICNSNANQVDFNWSGNVMPSNENYTTNNERLVSLRLNNNKQLVVNTELNNPQRRNLIIKSSKAYEASPTTDINTSITHNQTKTTFISNTLSEDKLQDKYYIYENNTKLFGPLYITNPQDYSTNNNNPVQTKSKKGLKLTEEEVDDAISLNVSHALIDVNLGDLYANVNGIPGDLPYAYGGKTYKFSSFQINRVINAVKKLNRAGISVTLVNIMYPESSVNELTYINKETTSYENGWPVAFNTKSGREGLEALLNYMAQEMTKSDCFVENWICGNEIQTKQGNQANGNKGAYNYAGNISWDEYAKVNADMFRLFNTAIKSHSKKAKTYLSFDPKWNQNQSTYSWGAKDLLSLINTKLKNEGLVHFDVALHPYSDSIVSKTDWWNDNQTDNVNTTARTSMKNINAIAKYINETYDGARVILSEQGFNGYRKSFTTEEQRRNLEKTQATAVAAAYYQAESSNYIDCFGYHRLKDHADEFKSDIFLGLYGINQLGREKYNNGSLTGNQIYDDNQYYQERYSAHVFRYMDTIHYSKYDRFARLYGGTSINNWASFPNLDVSKFTKNPNKVGNYLSPELVDYQIIYNGGDTYKLNLYIEAGSRILDVYAPTWSPSLNQQDITNPWAHASFEVKTETGGGKTMYHNYTVNIRKKDLPQVTHLYFVDSGEDAIVQNLKVMITDIPQYTVK